MFRRPLFVLAASVCIAATVSAGSYDPRLVSGKAKFVVFIDMEKGRESVLGDMLLRRITDNPEYQQFEDAMIQAAGFVPATDILDVTLYGEEIGPQPKGLLVLRAKFDVQKIRAAVGLAGGFETSNYNGHELMSWIDHRKSKHVHACIYDGTTILMTDNADTLKRGIDVLKEPADSLESDHDMPRPSATTSWAFVAVDGIDGAPDAVRNPVLRHAKRGWLEFGNDEKQTSVRVGVTAANEQAAQQLTNLANGAKALLQLNTPATKPVDGDSRIAAVRAAIQADVLELLPAVDIARTGQDVSLSLSVPTTRASKLLESMLDAKRHEEEADEFKPKEPK